MALPILGPEAPNLSNQTNFQELLAYVFQQKVILLFSNSLYLKHPYCAEQPPRHFEQIYRLDRVRSM